MEDDYVPKIGNRMGFIETIDDTLKIYRACVEQDDEEKFNFKDKMAFRGAIEHIKHSDLYHIGEEFNEMLNEWADQYHDLLYSEMRFSKFTRPPSNLCYVRFSQMERHLGGDDVKNIGLLTEYFEDGMTSVTFASPLRPPMPIGAYHPDKGLFFSSDKEFNPDDWDERKKDAISNIILELAGCFELINNPRFIVSEAAGTRSQRKQMKREQNIPLEAWHKISWNVDETTVVVNEKDGGGWRMPLHYTRGHPRKAEPHHKNVMYKDGKPYKWIEGFWSGHPAFGIKKGYHAPTLKAS
jgi:hypothetical protein